MIDFTPAIIAEDIATRVLWSFRDGEIIRHSEAGAIPLHPRVARALLANFKADGPWAAEHIRQLSAALAKAEQLETA